MDLLIMSRSLPPATCRSNYCQLSTCVLQYQIFTVFQDDFGNLSWLFSSNRTVIKPSGCAHAETIPRGALATRVSFAPNRLALGRYGLKVLGETSAFHC